MFIVEELMELGIKIGSLFPDTITDPDLTELFKLKLLEPFKDGSIMERVDWDLKEM